MSINKGLSINNKGLSINNKGLSINNKGLSINNKGLSINNERSFRQLRAAARRSASGNPMARPAR